MRNREFSGAVFIAGMVWMPGFLRWSAAILLCMSAAGALADGNASLPRAFISEVLWMGSDGNAADEWVEVGCWRDPQDAHSVESPDGVGAACAVSGWTVSSVNASGKEIVAARFATGTVIPAGGAIVIARYDAERSAAADMPFLVAPDLTLPNTKLRLFLRDGDGNMRDGADDGSGSPLAGENPSGGIGRASMERVRPDLPGEDSAAWATATESSGWDEGVATKGTPGTMKTERAEGNQESAIEAAEQAVVPTDNTAPPPGETCDAHDCDEQEQTLPSGGACPQPEPEIIVQSGKPSGVEKVSINLQAGNIPPGGTCQWSYPDDSLYDTCNPPNRSLASIGTADIVLTVTAACGASAERRLTVHVEAASTGTDDDDSAASCIPTAFTGITISEIAPRAMSGPNGAEDEWIELHNGSGMERILCGWLLDDDAGGSAAFALDDFHIPDDGYLTLPRAQTHIALNDSGDSARLIAPALRGQSGGIVDVLAYATSMAAQSLAVRDDGAVLWTPFPTPGSANRFRMETSVDGGIPVVIDSVLPNEDGVDGDGEWVALKNVAGVPVLLTDFRLQSGSSEFRIPRGTALRRGEVLQMFQRETGLSFPNSDGRVSLLDLEGNMLSALLWNSAAEGEVIRRPQEGVAVPGEVIDVAEDATLLLRLNGDPPLPVPEPVPLRLADIVIRRAREATVFLRSLFAADRHADIRFGAQLQDGTGMLQASVRTASQADVQAMLLRRGLAVVADASPSPDYRALEEEARREQSGIWADAEEARAVDQRQAQQEILDRIARDGLRIHADVASGRVATGSTVHLTGNVPGSLFVSVNSGAFRLSRGNVVITETTVLRAYLIVSVGNPDQPFLLRSPSWDGWFVPERAATGSVRITEVFPRPLRGSGAGILGEEWVELQNVGSSRVDLGGWMLDDVRGSGSRPWTIPVGTVLDSSEAILLRQVQTHVTHNDAGDDVWLLRPDGSVADSVTYPALKIGQAYAWVARRRWCITATPTPLMDNVCESPVSALAKGLKSKTVARKAARKALGPDPALVSLLQSITDGTSMDLSVIPRNLPPLVLLPLLVAFGAVGGGLMVVRRGRRAIGDTQ